MRLKHCCKKISTSCSLLLLYSIIIVLQGTSCWCNNPTSNRFPKKTTHTHNSQQQGDKQSKSNALAGIEIRHDLTTNQVKVVLHNKDAAAANMQLYYENISSDDKGKTALLEGKTTNILSANVTAGGSEEFTFPLDFQDSIAATFRFQIRQDSSAITTEEKTFQELLPKFQLKLSDRNSIVGVNVGDQKLFCTYYIQQEPDQRPVDHNHLSLQIKNQEVGEESTIFYNNQKIIELQLQGIQVVGRICERASTYANALPIELGNFTTKISITLQLFYKGISMGGPKLFSWQANYKGPTQALFDSIFCNDLSKVTEVLTANPALIGAKDMRGNTALHKALQNRSINKEIVQFLLDQGANLKATNENRPTDDVNTPLHIALANKNITLEIIRLLLDKDPSIIRARNRHNDSPLHTAAGNEAMTPEIIELLLAKGADPLAKNDNNVNFLPIFYTYKSNRAAFDLLLQKTGINNFTQQSIYFFLYNCIQRQNLEVIESLLNTSGIDVRFNERGRDFLVIAVEQYLSKVEFDRGKSARSLSVVKTLLSHGANKNLPDTNGITPLQLATNSTDKELRKIFGI